MIATTPQYVQQQTIQVVNKRAAFGHLATRAVKALCQKETDQAFFCIVTLSNGWGKIYYNVSISSSGLIQWRKA